MFSILTWIVIGFILYLFFDIFLMLCVAVVILLLTENYILPSLRGHELLYIVAIAVLLSLKRN